jgi:hypothetical protein
MRIGWASDTGLTFLTDFAEKALRCLSNCAIGVMDGKPGDVIKNDKEYVFDLDQKIRVVSPRKVI